MKESISIFGMGTLFYILYKILIKRKTKLIYILILPFSLFAISVKTYILYILLIYIFIWLVLNVFSKFKNYFVKLTLIGTILVFVSIGVVYFLSKINISPSVLFEDLDVVNSATRSASYLQRRTEEVGGSGYDLGKIEPTFSSMLAKVIPAINVTLFKPYIWEAKKIINLPAALESLFLMLFTLFVIFKTRLYGFILVLNKSPFLLSTFIYCLIFSFVVGFISFNILTNS